MADTTEKFPYAIQVAREEEELHPGGNSFCIRCRKYHPRVSDSGVFMIVCPFCGFQSPESFYKAYLPILQERRQRMAEEAQAADAAKVEANTCSHCAPPGLDDVIGNQDAIMQIRTAIDAHRGRGGNIAFPHTVISGPGGTGKTMLAEIIAREIKRPIRLQMGQSLGTPARVGDVLLSLKAGDVLFIDEIHGLKPAAQEALYRAMEDGVFVPITKAGTPVVAPIKLPPFTLIGSTTDEWGLLPSMLQRFKYRIRLERMTPGELAQAIGERAERKGIKLDAESAGMIADRSHGTPRLAIGLLDGCIDTAIAQGNVPVDASIVRMTCEIWGIDDSGLDKIARKYLMCLESAHGNPVRLNVLATKLDGLSRRTVETRIEPDLVWLGLIEKDSDGRKLTSAGKDHLWSKTK